MAARGNTLRSLGLVVLPVVVAGALAGPPRSAGQPAPAPAPLDRVLAFPAPVGEERLDADGGAMGAWHRLRKLATTASLLHVTAHPDDEHAGMLTLASRGRGVRTALLSLNRGEGGANAIGPELFDGLGLIRTRELVLSGRYYGLDDLYFTTAVDYGYSKSVDEAFRSWDREAVLEDMVRVIRLNRPLVVVGRFHGSARDGHGHHHAAGLLTPEAVAAAADPARFPRQISEEGLRPWRVLRTFRGGVRAGEPFHVEVDATGSSPWLGDTWQRWASRGLGLQRSQTAGRVRTGGGRYLYERLDRMDGIDPGAGEDAGAGDADAGENAGAGEDEPNEPETILPGDAGAGENAGAGEDTGGAGEVAASFFADLDTSLGGLPALLGEAAPRAGPLLDELQRSIADVVDTFDFRAPERSVPGLVRGLGLLRSAIAATADAPETRFHLRLKGRQIEDAIVAASGVRVVAALEGPARGAVLVPGESATVRVAVETPGNGDVTVGALRVTSRNGDVLARQSSPDGSAPRQASPAGVRAVPRRGLPTGTVDAPRDPRGAVATLQIRIPPTRDGWDDLARDRQDDLARDRRDDLARDRQDDLARDRQDDLARDGQDDLARDGRDDLAAAPYFGRDGLAENHYRISDATDLHLSWRRPALSARVELSVAGHVFERRVPVAAPVPRLPYGSVTREVAVLPALSVSVEPEVRIVPVVPEPAEGRDPGAASHPSRAASTTVVPEPADGRDPGTAGAGGEPVVSPSAQVRVRTSANVGPLAATIRLDLPDGWTSTPETVLHEFRNRGETAEASFTVTPPAGWRGTAEVRAVARAEGTAYRAGYRTIEHRDLRLARLWRPARTAVRAVPVARLDGTRIGYVMGVGDEVPAGIEALGATVELLDEAALAALARQSSTGDPGVALEVPLARDSRAARTAAQRTLPRANADAGAESRFDAIVVGTRAYAVRADLLEHNRGLLEYARRGGNLIVLYQTQEYAPSAMAPYPASRPRSAEEVSEEDAPVRLLVPDHPLLTAPNRITEADFDGWIEQRGSKFFTDWDPAYTPLVETHDRGQAPQEGVWLTAPVGEGRFTYLALALHRQLPYGVPGAYRILSNVLSRSAVDR